MASVCFHATKENHQFRLLFLQLISTPLSLRFVRGYFALLKLRIMKNILVLTAVLFSLIAFGSWTLKDQETIDNTLPTTTSPAEMIGGWSSGYASFTQVVDAYNGRILGNTWQSGKYLKITPDGKNAEFYIMSQSQYLAFATQVGGTIRFDAESTNSRGSFTFLALKAHYKGFGKTKVDRDATPQELKNNLTQKYFYRMDGNWLRIEPNAEPNDYSSSFRKVSE